ncbi:hypothetical protein ASE12_08470 [Aeromicrobium sp. Root236]|uniref:hypothetical protein n=1 Tax=Aeromicrobium sp. Root236 TaxID=1736498 RepID=UPI0006F7CDFA|nr:hypothetical protein [Aeromicrobium sp. Root236]KRC64802.1 hypothetical protein ASE12_08470 [Aeromicrobium sp. Root236]
MSDPNGPTRRRRIAGEGKPAVPAAKPAARKVPARAAAAKKAATQKATVAAPPKAAPTVKAARPPKVAKPASDKPSNPDLRWTVPAALVAAVVLVLGVVLTFQGVRHVRGAGDRLDDAREQATAAAASAVETVFTYKYNALDKHLSSSTALMTPSFAKTFKKYEPALQEAAQQRSVQMQSVVGDAAALPCGDECSTTKMDVLVFYDQARLTSDSKTPSVFSNRASVSMVKTDDGWLVDDIRAR